MKYRIISLIIVISLLIVNCCLAETKGMHADPNFNHASAIFSSTYCLDIDFETIENQKKLGVYSCWLQQRVNSTWVTQDSIARPLYVATNTCTYVTTINYSSALSLTGTYRIKVVIYGGPHSKTIYSNACTF